MDDKVVDQTQGNRGGSGAGEAKEAGAVGGGGAGVGLVRSTDPSLTVPTPGATPGHAINLEGLFSVGTPKSRAGSEDGTAGEQHQQQQPQQQATPASGPGAPGGVSALGLHDPASRSGVVDTQAHAPAGSTNTVPAPSSFDASKPAPPGTTRGELRLVHSVLRDIILQIPSETPDEELPTYRDLRKQVESQLQKQLSTKPWREWLRAQVDGIFAEVDEMDAADVQG